MDLGADGQAGGTDADSFDADGDGTFDEGLEDRQLFANEMAALSWNLMMLSVGFSFAGDLAFFQGWTLHAIGPEELRDAAEDEISTPFLMDPPESVITPPDSPFIRRSFGEDGMVGTGDDLFVGAVTGRSPRP